MAMARQGKGLEGWEKKTGSGNGEIGEGWEWHW